MIDKNTGEVIGHFQNHGNRIENEYILKIDKQGNHKLVKTGERDLQEEIQSFENTCGERIIKEMYNNDATLTNWDEIEIEENEYDITAIQTDTRTLEEIKADIEKLTKELAHETSIRNTTIDENKENKVSNTIEQQDNI